MPFSERKELIDFLRRKDSYEHHPKEVVHLQTHASDVFIVSPYVYKVKKPVNFGFLDFSTLEKRRFFCQKEVELNRRLCEHIYLGVVPICKSERGFSFLDCGEVVEYAVKMKELDERFFLKNLLREGKVNREHFLRIVDKLEKFYKEQKSEEKIKDYATPSSIERNVMDNLEGTFPFVSETLSPLAFRTLEMYNRRFLKKKEKLFFHRIDRGFIKDCHGDLHLEHINICPERVCIYDCIEFNDSFRYIDVASDVAFLSMDLDFNGYPEFADFFIQEISNRIDDGTIDEIIDFYKCYRAAVRGKVESIKSTDEQVSTSERKLSIKKARSYYQLALRYALFGSRPCIIVVFGVIGTGKSTLAEVLSQELGARVFSSDRIRKEITGLHPYERVKKGIGKGIYTPEVTERTYSEMLRRGFELIGLRDVVIFDATFSKRSRRLKVLEEAKKRGIRCIFIETTASIKTIESRLTRREREGRSVSDAGPWLLESFLKGYERPDEIPSDMHIKVDTDMDIELIVSYVFEKMIELSV